MGIERLLSTPGKFGGWSRAGRSFPTRTGSGKRARRTLRSREFWKEEILLGEYFNVVMVYVFNCQHSILELWCYHRNLHVFFSHYESMTYPIMNYFKGFFFQMHQKTT